MKKVLKIVGILVLLAVVVIAGIGIALHEKEPIGENQAQADQLAREMMAAVDKVAWDSTRWIRWTFIGGNTYTWDKDRHFVLVENEGHQVRLNAHTVAGNVTISGQKTEGQKVPKLVQKAWSGFCNDSFWLNPVVKAFDAGTERSLVTLKDGREGLKVKYASGGVTPGDSYVWILDENNLPVAWKMWVKIIPIGGLETSWENWTQLSTGAKIATNHKAFGKDFEMITNLKEGRTYADLGYAEDPFAGM